MFRYVKNFFFFFFCSRNHVVLTLVALVGYGLSVRQAIACSVSAGVMYGFIAVANGWMGSHHHIGFVAIARACYGINGHYFALVIKILSKIIWFAVQSYYGGIAVSVAIAGLSPNFATWNTFSLTPVGNIASNDFVGMILYMLIMIPCLMIPPERLYNLFRVTFVFVFMSMIGMLIYAMKENHGPGSLLTQSSNLQGSGELAWAVVQGIFSILGTYGGGISGQSDWTRYAKKKSSATWAQIIGAPTAVTFAGTLGALITSASNDLFGAPIWNPVQFLRNVLIHEDYSSRARVGVFFAALGFVGQQLSINLLLNGVSAGMEMSGLCPKYLNIRRCTFIILFVSLACCPWYLQANATVVIIFGSGWGIFCSSITGVSLTKYFFIYRRKFLLSDLYKADSLSIYWFYKGYDWRAIVAWCVGTGFLLPGLAAQARGEDWGFWNKIFKVSYGWGIGISSLTIVILHYIFPHYDIPVDSTKDPLYTLEGDLIENDLSSDSGVIESLKNGVEIKTFAKEV